MLELSEVLAPKTFCDVIELRKGSFKRFVDVISDGELVVFVVVVVLCVGEVEGVEEDDVGVDGGRRGKGKGEGGGEIVGTTVEGMGAGRVEITGIVGTGTEERGGLIDDGTVGGEDGNRGLVISGTMLGVGSVLMIGGGERREPAALIRAIFSLILSAEGLFPSGKRSGITGLVISDGNPESGGREGRELGKERATACFMKLRKYDSCSFMSLFSVSSNSILAVTYLILICCSIMHLFS